MTQEPYYKFLLKLVKNKRAIIELPKIEKIIEEKKNIDYKITPWKTQQNLLDKINKSKLMGMVQAPTGSGKTNMFSFLIGKFNMKTLVIVPTTDLVTQTKNRIISVLDIDKDLVGQYSGKVKKISKITVSTWQSLQKEETFKKFVDYGFNMIIADEAHRVSAEKFGWILDNYPAKYKFGFTATPFHTRGKNTEKMRSLLGDIFYKINIETLYKDGSLVRPNISFINTNNTMSMQNVFINRYIEDARVNSKFKFKMINSISSHLLIDKDEVAEMEINKIAELYFKVDKFGQTYSNAIDGTSDFRTIPNSVRNGALGILKAGVDKSPKRLDFIQNFIAKTVKGAKKSLILFNTIKSCEDFIEFLKEKGIDAILITGKNRDKALRIKAFNDNEDDTAVAVGTTSLLGEGIDIPSLNTLYVCSPIHPPFFDLARGIQVPGRAIRKSEGKKEANIIFFDDTIEHYWIDKKRDELKEMIANEFKPVLLNKEEMIDKINGHTETVYVEQKSAIKKLK